MSSSPLLLVPTFLCLCAATGLHLILALGQDSIAALSNQASYGLSLALLATGSALAGVALRRRPAGEA